MLQTKFERTISQLVSSIFSFLIGPWKRRSLSIISILLGFYLGSNIPAFVIDQNVSRTYLSIIFLFIYEILIRIRTQSRIKPLNIWFFLDGLRIGSLYAIVLEAFKLGS